MQESVMQRMWNSAYLSGGNAAYVEELYELYLHDPNAVPEEWRTYFQKLPADGSSATDVSHSTIRDHFVLLAKNQRRAQPVSAGSVSSEHEKKQVEVLRLIQAYRMRGHQAAQLDPLGLWQRPAPADLSINHYGLTNADLDTTFRAGDLFIGKEEASLREIHEALQQTYCRTIGAEFTHITDSEQRHWFQQRLESVRGRPTYSADIKSHLLERVTAGEGLEKYLGTKYPGTKRFGLEGGESLIPMLDELIQRSGSYGTKEVVIGMAHRGRLNVLVNTFGKNPRELFDEFEGKKKVELGSGDVKYHQGFSSNVMTAGGEVHLAMAFNPSHLEIVSPVVEGSVRARQDRRNDPTGEKVLPISIHGDAAFAGQGVVMETFQMSQTRGFKTGGTVHIVINNQVGFTISNPLDSRSTEYATDVAKMIQAPILHVNGDDPEAVLFVTQLAIDYRMQFKRDVVIDLVCYRRRGHNEADEPSGTQPLMYQQITKQRTTRELYADRLTQAGVLDAERVQAKVDEYRNALDNGLHVVKSLVKEPNKELFVDWRPYLGHAWTARHDTRFDLKTLQELSAKLLEIPEGFVVQRQVAKIYEDRQKMQAGGLPINWGYAETMAYATLAFEGHPIRMTGQDIGRGTFSHRHAVLHNQKDAGTYIPLKHLYEGQPRFDLYDSFLSEEAVLAFEYGYSTTTPNALVIWEAQFGDFANGAQVVIDQFITSGEHKWGRLCGLTMLLPHGYEGQGPEHSSARLERYLQLCAEHNIQVCMPTTPAQIYHLLRRQVIRPLRKPLVVLTPKSLLRHKLAVSTLEDLAEGSFQTVIPEIDALDPKKVERVVLCSGKVYYDLLEKRRAEGRDDIAIVRIEQLYPFPEDDLKEVLAPYTNVKHAVWCQEEPMNQGAWYCSQHHLRRSIGNLNKSLVLEYAGREASAAPACGYASMHAEQQEKLLQDAFTV
ncbi:2-oxoglutarate dehydrogenase E1 component [Pseudomonas sp. RSB 5.4]|jgi:2-oxoglutarate dehydrogenase E1 component|uniref:2-oxoglutarate dehydrogenase E1 component n=1 Tax=Pseudomonas fluorescens R124 TaxID=743713 RepID=A0A7U9CL41_PSEFL|nr:MULTISPECIES: 2-oxoglutarate dehydrogenase E1 component [Pseudomonas]RBB99927.1 2-oxoglutarate dehydrogenase E1 component [Pseudomonas sp. MWU12-2115]RBL72155.1 2-oxoglutarate dehydrogenase E1 component [Pseudomonas sp. MWU13-2625]EJZ57270.1 2-oxoglutarate dehydrogenase [Pseudomonas fluorescens R124]MBK5345283.1 2-oxoglutarate dehydrogenase E1 component [Pseudomonas sp. TH49]MCU1773444.1 2-oxoglutarate dehydrogenase E1 component [Pseudomonas sp. 13B_3.2_Bac1]